MTSRHSRHRRDDSPTFDSDSETYVEHSDDSRSPSPAGLREAYRERRGRSTHDSLGKAVLVVGLVVAACVVQHLRVRRAGEQRYHEDQRREHEMRRQERRRRRHEREAWQRQRALEDWEERRARPRIEGAPLESDGRKMIEAPPAGYDSNTRQYDERDGYDDRRSRR